MGLSVEVGGREVGAISACGGNARQCPFYRVHALIMFPCRSLMVAHAIFAEGVEVGGDSGATAMGEVSGCRSPSATVANGCCFFFHRLSVFMWVSTMSPKSSLGLVAHRLIISLQKKILNPSLWRAVALSLHLATPSESGNI